MQEQCHSNWTFIVMDHLIQGGLRTLQMDFPKDRREMRGNGNVLLLSVNGLNQRERHQEGIFSEEGGESLCSLPLSLVWGRCVSSCRVWWQGFEALFSLKRVLWSGVRTALSVSYFPKLALSSRVTVLQPCMGCSMHSLSSVIFPFMTSFHLLLSPLIFCSPWLRSLPICLHFPPSLLTSLLFSSDCAVPALHLLG